MAAQSHSTSEERRLHNSTFVNRSVCFYFPVVRLMAVEDELRGGAIPDIKPRILTDQVCACVYTTSHVLNHYCITSKSVFHRNQHRLRCLQQLPHMSAASIVQSTLFCLIKKQHFTASCTHLAGGHKDQTKQKSRILKTAKEQQIFLAEIRYYLPRRAYDSLECIYHWGTVTHQQRQCNSSCWMHHVGWLVTQVKRLFVLK